MPETLPIRYAQSLLRLAKGTREELREELGELKLPLVLLEHKAAPEAQIPVEDYGRLFIYLIRKLQPELMAGADEVSAAIEFSTYNMLFLAMAHSTNLEQAMQRAAVYFRRFETQGDTFVLESAGDQVCCRFEFSERESQRELVAAANFDMGSLNWLQGATGRILSLALWHRVCSWFVGAFIELDSVQLAQAAAGSEDRHAEIFGAPVEFDAGQYSFRFHRRYLEFPVVQGEAAVARMLENFPAEILRLDPKPSSVSNAVSGLIGTDFTGKLASLQEVADRLHMTTPTLHRRLREEGSSFQQLKDRARRDAAIQLIRSGDHSGAQLAELTGFSDASTFHRAFKKWTGLTLQEFRRQQT